MTVGSIEYTVGCQRISEVAETEIRADKSRIYYLGATEGYAVESSMRNINLRCFDADEVRYRDWHRPSEANGTRNS